MHLSQLILENFRSYQKKSFEFSPTVNLIIGHNGSGKTNILESIYFLATGKSFRSSSSGQLISWEKNYSTVIGKIVSGSQSSLIEAQLIKNPATASYSRKFFINRLLKTRSHYLGTLKVVVFEPEDIRLVTGSPGRRRDYLDSVFLTSEWRYAQSLSQYNRALKHRNELLDLIRTNRSQVTELFYWNQSLVKNADIIQSHRQKFLNSINSFFKNHSHPEIRQIAVSYHPSLLTQEKIDVNQSQEIIQGYTLFGPHRDDITFNSSQFNTPDKNIAFWGSRGQQRLAVLALKLAQINYLEETYHELPVLLLDDIFSELDEDYRHLVVDICHQYQTIFTSADPQIHQILPQTNLIEISSAQT